jgi:hypothetical protein
VTEVADRPRPDTTDMLAVHHVFRDSLAEAPELVGAVAGGDTGRAAVVGTYYDNVLKFLHVHHEGEDDLVWPPLLERAVERAELVQRIAAQHGDVVDLVARAEAALTGWTAAPDAASGAALVTALGDLRTELVLHLDEEEQHVLPLAAEHLSVEEWGGLPAHGMSHFAGDKLWLILGLLRAHMSQQQRDEMLAHMPPPAAQFWTNVGEGLYTGFMTELRR